MATYNSEQYNNGIAQVGTGDFGNMKVCYGTYEIGTALTIGQTIAMFTAPAGFIPLGGVLMGDDLDTGTETLEIDVGTVADSTKYLNSGVITGDTGSPDEKITVGIRLPLQEDLMTVKPTAFTADTDIILTFTAAAAAGGTGTITLYMYGLYNDARA